MATSIKMIQKRNVVVLGKTGSGKSTVANRISASDTFKVLKTAKSVTSKVSHCEVSLDDQQSNVRYDIKVIDTIGLFDNSPNTARRTNAAIIKEIKEYFNKNIPEGITLVLFVFRQGRYTQEEEDTFKFITDNFKSNISDMCALIITNCDNEDDAERKKIIADFSRNAGQTAELMGKGIYAVGFPDTTKMKPKVRKALEDDIKNDEEILRNLVKKSGEMRLGKELFEPTFWEKLAQCTIL